MSSNMISREDADLILHRLVTERRKSLCMFVSADGKVNGTMTGFVSSVTRELGLVISTSLNREGEILSFMTFSDLSGCSFEYADDSEMPQQGTCGSGLRLTFPNGDTLAILEFRD